MGQSKEQLIQHIKANGFKLHVHAKASNVMFKSFRLAVITKRLRMNSYFLERAHDSIPFDLPVGVHHCIAVLGDNTIVATVVCVKEDVDFDAEMCFFDPSGEMTTPDDVRIKSKNGITPVFWMVPVNENKSPFREVLSDLVDGKLLKQLCEDGMASVGAQRRWRKRMNVLQSQVWRGDKDVPQE